MISTMSMFKGLWGEKELSWYLDDVSGGLGAVGVLDGPVFVSVEVLHRLEVLVADADDDDAHRKVGRSHDGGPERGQVVSSGVFIIKLFF